MVAAKRASAAAAPGQSPVGAFVDGVMGQLVAHKAMLKQYQSTTKKEEVKATIIPEYADYIDGVLSADSGAQDTVIVTLLAWAMDAGDYETGLRLGEYALRHDLKMPPEWRRTVATVVVEVMAERMQGNPELDDAAADYMQRAFELTADKDMPDEVRAKVLVVLGDLRAASDPPLALKHYDDAMSLNPRCGRKGLADKLRKTITAQTEPPPDKEA
jgi:hypothetical protein